MAWECRKTKTFEKSFASLSPAQQELARRIYNDVFKKNPFDPSLGAHKIHKLSSRYRTTVYAIRLEGNLRVTFQKDGDYTVTALDIGTHDIYK